VHKYNHKSKFAMVTSHIVETTLGAASLTPTFVGPAAKVALLSFVMATGGPESCKLTKELYLDKRLESRWKVVNEEAHLALDNYHIAVLTKNPVLLAFSESLVGEMSGVDTVPAILGTSVLCVDKVTSGNASIQIECADNKLEGKDQAALKADAARLVAGSQTTVAQ
jgi:hypothetical protein